MHLVVFDIDGTLTRTCSVDELCYVRAVAEELGIAGFSTDWLEYAHVTDGGILHELALSRWGRPPRPEEVERVLVRFHTLLEEAFAADAGACLAVEGGPATLAALAGEPGRAVALATGGWGLTARLKLRTAGYDVNGIPLASGSDALAREEIMEIAERRSKELHAVAGFATVTYVGDGLWDARAAARLGWRFVGVGEGKRAERLRAEGAVAVVSGYEGEGFLELVRRMDAHAP